MLTQHARLESRLESLQMHFTSRVPQLPKLVTQPLAQAGRPGILAPRAVLASSALVTKVRVPVCMVVLQ